MKIPKPFSTDRKKNWKRRGKNSKLACQNEIHDRETECVCVRMRVCERDCYPTPVSRATSASIIDDDARF